MYGVRWGDDRAKKLNMIEDGRVGLIVSGEGKG